MTGAATSEGGGRVRSWWGWGWEDQALSDADCAALGALLPGSPDRPLPVPRVADLDLPAPRIGLPAALAGTDATSPASRASHGRGKAYRDVVRALHGDAGAPPDVVARPADEAGVVALLDWAADADVAVVPFGGGSSVVGGVECDGEGRAGVVSLDLTAMDRVLEVDRTSRAARVQAGVLGPALEDQLRPDGLTLRHFPQSFEFSTLGGWIATRAGGHYATLRTHIDDLVESIRAVTPVGVSESWRLPGSGAGPSPDRLLLGSEGTLGVITEAWVRLQDRPEHRRSATATFADGADALAAVRAIAQSDLHPANCRLLDPAEAAMSGAGPGDRWVLVLGVESAVRPVDDAMALLVELARDHGGTVADAPAPDRRGDGAPAEGWAGAGRDRAAETWRSAFLRMPYQRDALARMGAVVETFETATTWDRLPGLYEAVRAEVGAAIEEVTGAPGLLTCRLTHVYPDGAAPYFTVVAGGRPGAELSMWDQIKAASMEVLTRHRATVTHHHAVGRDHRPGYDRQRPEPFALALRAAKRALDPAAILNPGVLIDP
ncbi:FAD-binding oxidoreductase [Dermatobacter hominis]|uniref:FAD-binding oxidoreductase n=1 Tax=Dermatobacter hominis TaxID=2884263 RepID=UPI001D126943|nr:FAD-binding oxidoreductase [Dermatobacter hominis]UDY35318.1 FAD-binding oxidoreductase [Dermatobacter hominis]